MIAHSNGAERFGGQSAQAFRQPRRNSRRHAAHNLEAALQVTGISDIQITASPGQVIAPPPEGASYLGFIFAQGMSPLAVESSLRLAHQRLVFEIQADIPVNQANSPT